MYAFLFRFVSSSLVRYLNVALAVCAAKHGFNSHTHTYTCAMHKHYQLFIFDWFVVWFQLVFLAILSVNIFWMFFFLLVWAFQFLENCGIYLIAMEKVLTQKNVIKNSNERIFILHRSFEEKKS